MTAWFLLLLNIFLRLCFPETPLGSLWNVKNNAVLVDMLADADISWAMPQMSFVYFAVERLPFGMEFFPLALFCAVMALLLLGTGIALRSLWTGLLAPVLFFLFLLFPVPGVEVNAHSYVESMCYAVAVMLVGYALVLRARLPKRSLLMELVLASCIGFSFMIKSPLALLPPFLAVYDLWNGKLRNGETSWKLLLAGCIFPYLFLLPWMYMNYAFNGHLLFFENGRASQNIISGVMGIVYTMEGAQTVAEFTPGSSVLLWAAKTVLSHPLAYLASLLQRIYLAFSWYPLLSSVFIAALFRFRRDAKIQAMGCLALYFVLMHSMLSTDPRYFYPLWPVLVLCCAAMLDFGEPAGRKGKEDVFSKFVFFVFFVLATFNYLTLSRHLLAYHRDVLPSRERVEVDERAGRVPDFETLAYAAQMAFSDDEAEAAYGYARRALLRRKAYESSFAYARAAVANGKDILPLLKQQILDCGVDRVGCEFILAADAVQKGQDSLARKYFQLAYQRNLEETVSLNAYDIERSAAIYSAHRTADATVVLEGYLKLAEIFPPKLAARMKNVFLRADPPLSLNETGRLDFALGRYLLQGRRIFKELTPDRVLARYHSPVLRLLAEELCRDAFGHTPFPCDHPAYCSIMASARQALGLDYVAQLRHGELEQMENAKALLCALLLFLDEARPPDYERISAHAALYLDSGKVLELIDENFQEGTGVALARIYLKYNNNGTVRARLASQFLRFGRIAEAAAELKHLPSDNSLMPQLSRQVLDSPDARGARAGLDRIFADKNYAGFVAEAKAYLEDFPFDISMRLRLAEALLATRDFPAAVRQFDLASRSKLSAEQQAFVAAGRLAAQDKAAAKE